MKEKDKPVWKDLGLLLKFMMRGVGAQSAVLMLKHEGGAFATLCASHAESNEHTILDLKAFQERFNEIVEHAENASTTWGDNTAVYTRESDGSFTEEESPDWS